MAAASWQAASRPNHLTHDKFLQAYHTLEASAPGQNLNRRIPSKSSVVAEYHLSGTERTCMVIPDWSGNGYDALFSDGVVYTPLGSKGHNYTLLITTAPTKASKVQLSGPDTDFGLAVSGSSTTLAFNSSNILYPLLNYTFQPVKSREVILVGTEQRTAAWVDGSYVGDFIVKIGGTDNFQPMAFVAPAQQIQGVETFVLWDGVQDIAEISKFKP